MIDASLHHRINGDCTLGLANVTNTIRRSKTGYKIGDEQVAIAGVNKAMTLNATANT